MRTALEVLISRGHAVSELTKMEAHMHVLEFKEDILYELDGGRVGKAVYCWKNECVEHFVTQSGDMWETYRS